MSVSASVDMRIGVVVGLPSDVERFEPVLRRLPGAEFLELRAQWVCPRFDAREATRRALRRRGRRALAQPTANFDLVLAPDCYGPHHLQEWLSPRGRIVAWCDPDRPGRWWSRPEPLAAAGGAEGGTVATARAEVALLITSSEIYRRRPAGLLEVVTGDPLADGFFDVGAPARARGALGLDAADRGLLTVLVESAQDPTRRWAPELASLRTEFDVVFHLSESARMDRAWTFPRCWRGPGMYVVDQDVDLRLADLFAASTAVIGAAGARARLAQELAVPTVAVVDGSHSTRRMHDGRTVGRQPSAFDIVCEDRDHLTKLVTEAIRARGQFPDARQMHRLAAARLADRLGAARQLLPD